MNAIAGTRSSFVYVCIYLSRAWVPIRRVRHDIITSNNTIQYNVGIHNIIIYEYSCMYEYGACTCEPPMVYIIILLSTYYALNNNITIVINLGTQILTVNVANNS